MHHFAWLYGLVVATGIAGVLSNPVFKEAPEFTVVPKEGGGHRIVKTSSLPPSKEKREVRDRSHELVKRGALPYLTCAQHNYKKPNGDMCQFEQESGECLPKIDRQAYQLICWGCTNLEQFDQQRPIKNTCPGRSWCEEYEPYLGQGVVTKQIKCVEPAPPKVETFKAKTDFMRLDTMTCSDEVTIPRNEQTIEAIANTLNDDVKEYTIGRSIDFVVNDEIKATYEHTAIANYDDTLNYGDKIRVCITTIGRAAQVLTVAYALLYLPQDFKSTSGFS